MSDMRILCFLTRWETTFPTEGPSRCKNSGTGVSPGALAVLRESCQSHSVGPLHGTDQMQSGSDQGQLGKQWTGPQGIVSGIPQQSANRDPIRATYTFCAGSTVTKPYPQTMLISTSVVKSISLYIILCNVSMFMTMFITKVRYNGENTRLVGEKMEYC